MDEETDMKVTVGVGGGVVISSVALEAGGLLIIDFRDGGLCPSRISGWPLPMRSARSSEQAAPTA